MSYDVEVVFGPGDQVDLEIWFGDYMLERAKNAEFVKKNPWGECFVLQGNILHGIQWSYVGLENTEYDEDGYGIGDWYWEDEPDFEVDCSWHEIEDWSTYLSTK